MNREWTTEELEILRRDREAKIPVPVTAAKLGRPVPATYLRARLIGTQVQSHRAWEKEDVARLRELVMADPPLTDKRIAAELGRTVSQVRWKMKDLDLIGVRDISKLAQNASPKAVSSAPQVQQAASRPAATPKPFPKPEAKPKASVQQALPRTDLYTPFDLALKRLETQLKARLKESVAEAEVGMVQAARAAIAEKHGIDQRLAKLHARIAHPDTSSEKTGRKMSRPAREDKKRATTDRTKAVAPRPPSVLRKTPSAPALTTPPAPKIIVVETPAAARPAVPDLAPTSGRGGWKSVRRDPARVAAQGSAKATKRADAVDLAEAAQAAIDRFIAERGVTKATTDATQALASRLRARGYIVVREETGWLIDQRHRIENDSELVEFAQARGISLDVAA